MKITESQIEELFQFTRKHLVEHYDLQTELVDHLANGIEAQWLEHPERSFKDARLREFRKFGVSGFETVIRKRRQTMARRYRKIIFQFFKEYFRLPKIIYFMSAIVLCFTLLSKLKMSWKYDCILGLFYLIIIFVFAMYFKSRKDNELEQVKYGKRWMLKDQIYDYHGLANILNIISITLNYSFFRNNIPMNNFVVDLIFATVIVCLVVLCYLMVFIIPQKAEKLLAETYPEYQNT